MRSTPAALLGAALLLWVPSSAAAAELFRLGTFEARGESFLGIVLRDAYAVDLGSANASLERHNRMWVRLPMPEDMKELAGRWHLGMRERVHAIAEQVVSDARTLRRRAAGLDPRTRGSPCLSSGNARDSSWRPP